VIVLFFKELQKGHERYCTLQLSITSKICKDRKSHFGFADAFIITSSPTQPLQIQDLLQRISNGRLLLPNIEGLRTGQEARTTERLSELKLTNLMINTNCISAILSHLQGVIGDLRTIQTQEYSCRLTAGGELALSEVATQVVERTLDQEFNDLSLSHVDTELEDFGEVSS